MSKDYFVGPRQDKWQAKQPGAEKASGVFDTQKEAIAQAKEWAVRSGGGEVTIQGRNGQIRAKDTMPPKIDKFPPRG